MKLIESNNLLIKKTCIDKVDFELVSFIKLSYPLPPLFFYMPNLHRH